MEVQSLEVYATDSNYSIIKPPGRNFPGCVIQGDSLAILGRAIRGIAKRAQRISATDPELVHDIVDLNNALVDRLLHYQQLLAAHGISLPYGSPFGIDDMIPLPAADSAAGEVWDEDT